MMFPTQWFICFLSLLMMAASIPIPAPNLSYLDSDDDYPDLLTDQQYYRMLMEHKIGDW